jgi:hypothetical protein
LTREPQFPFPTTLDEIVTKHRAHISIGLATESELPRSRRLLIAGLARTRLAGWQLKVI